MNRVRNVRVGWPLPLRALVVTATLTGIATVGAAAPAVAQVKAVTAQPAAAKPAATTPADSAPAAEPGKLTLENAKPMPVPPPANLPSQATVKPPTRFVAPRPVEPPPLPSIAELSPVGPPTMPAGSPPVPARTRPASAPPPIPPMEQPAKPAAAPPAQTAAQTAPTQTAALPPQSPPPARPPVPRGPLSVVFDGEAADLPESAEATISKLADTLRANETLRLQLRAYASGTADTAREARQLSLARALALRERLTAFGIRSTRIDIRALGVGATEGPPDRIDAEFLN